MKDPDVRVAVEGLAQVEQQLGRLLRQGYVAERLGEETRRELERIERELDRIGRELRRGA